jgi:hypothetical protein
MGPFSCLSLCVLGITSGNGSYRPSPSVTLISWGWWSPIARGVTEGHSSGCARLSGFFSAIWMVVAFHSSVLVAWGILWVGFWVLTHPCVPGTNYTWPWLLSLFNIQLDWVCRYRLENYCICIHERSWFILYFQVFYIKIFITSWKWIGAFSIVFPFLGLFQVVQK